MQCQCLEALQQIYGYMTFNNVRYSVLSNWQRAWFLQRIETPDRKTLKHFLIKLNGAGPSMLKAWVGILLLAEDDWFYSSPTPSNPPPSRSFGTSNTALANRKEAFLTAGSYAVDPNNSTYPLLDLDFRLCNFQLVMCGPGWALKPGLGPGLSGLGLS